MALDTEQEDVEETEGGSFEQEQEDTTNDAPQTKTFDRESFVNDAYAEGAEESVIEDLAGKEDITLDDLRQIPGTEGLSDAQLTAAWTKAQAEAGIASGTNADGTPADTKVEIPFPVYDDKGNKIASDKVTLADLLSGKALVGYNAMGKEQRKALTEVLRNASQGHWNEHRYNTVNQQYRQAFEQLTALQKETAGHKEMQTQWNAALTALITGNQAPMAALVNAYKTELTKAGQAPPAGFVSQESANAERENAERGMQWWSETGIPAAYDIAANYGADKQEVQNAIKWYIENEPSLTPSRIEEIIKYDVPMLLESNGYSAKGEAQAGIRTGGQPNGVATQENDKVTALEKQVAALTQRLAGNANDRVAAVREKGKRTPPAGSGATSGAGDSMPTFKTRGAMKEWLQS